MTKGSSQRSSAIYRSFSYLWSFLTRPSGSIQSFESRRQATLLSALLVFQAPGFYIPQVVRAIHGDRIELLFYYTPVFLLLVASYGLSRTRRHTIGAVLAVFVVAVIPFWGLVAAGDYGQKGVMNALIWAVLPVFMSALLLPLHFMLIAATAVFGGILLLPVLVEEITFMLIFYPYAYVNGICVLIIIGAVLRSKDFKHIDAQRRKLAESEETYRSIVENTNDVIMLSSPDGVISYLSPACKKVFGYDPAELIGAELSIVHEKDIEKAVMVHHQVLSGKSGSNFEYRIRSKGGETKYVSHSWRPIHKGDRIQKIVSVVRDVSDLRRMEEDLLRAQKLESIGVLAGGIAHDFNNIMMAFLGNVSLAKMSIDPSGEIYELLTEAERASMQAKALTNQLLTFAKGGAPIKETASIGEIIRDTARFVLRGSIVKCDSAIPNDLRAVEVDAGQISQVISNVIINAQHAMPEGGIINVQTENVSVGPEDHLPLQGGQYVKISIKDKGIGIAEEHLSKIFDPYFTTKKQGGGLGLATCYSIIKKHAGYITVDSELAAGTTVQIYLPVSTNEITARKPAELKEDVLAGRGRILVMDDERLVREVAGRMLVRIGYEVTTAKDGDEAIELYRSARESGQPLNAVILDLTIPGGMGGKETVERLLKMDPEVKAIVSSGYSINPVMADFRQYGFSGVISKPYAVEKLSRALYKVLQGEDDT